jgi:predicted TIM-barrel fold metal-dependent hydrolase
VSVSEAGQIWTKGLSSVAEGERKAFQDAMMHAVCERCAHHRLPFQIHTGIQAGNFNTLADTNPLRLTNLFQTYPDVRFDIFHGGYPFTQEAGLMAKYFPNVYVDGCWLAHITPRAYKAALDEWIEIVPANKIFAWGGDHGIIDHSYASLLLAKDLISEVLARKVASGYFSEKVALHLAERIVGRNACEVYGFE